MNPGECQCNVTCAAGDSCQLYYRDYDGDGYGDINGSTTTNAMDGTVTAYVGCSNVAPKPGYVADHTDCDDLDARAHPGQTAYFGTPMTGISPPSYDFNCDGILEKSIPEYPGMSCEFCDATPTCGATTAACTAAGEQGTFGCGPRLICLGGICKPPLICPIRCSFGGCYPNTETGFQSTVACGATASTTTCGTCAAVSEAAAVTYTAGVQQMCH
jgi:hypothetical protein